MMQKMDTMTPMLSSFAKMIGIALLFVGTLVIVIGGTEPSSCFTSTAGCGAGALQTALNSILAARIIWTIGLAGLAFGAGLKLRSVTRNPSPGTTAEAIAWTADRARNGMLFAVSAVLMVVVGLPFFFAGTPGIP